MEGSLAGPCKRRRDKAAGEEEGGELAAGDSCLHASLALAIPAHMSKEPHAEISAAAAAAACTEGGAGDDCDAATAAGGLLAPILPTLYEVLARLLITDRNIRDSWR
jgi:hypothetical protein